MINKLSEKIRKKVENKQKWILTNTNLKSFGYIRQGKKSNDVQQWSYYGAKSLEEKIKNKQKTISTNSDLSKFGYIKYDFRYGSQIWRLNNYKTKINKKYRDCHKKEASEYSKEWRKNHKDELKIKKHEYYMSHREELDIKRKEWYSNHKEKFREYSRKYYQTEKGRIKSFENSYKHKQKGFIPLFKIVYSNDIKTEWHHINKNLPFVIPIPEKIHRSIHGSNPNHYLGVVAKFYGWLENHPEIKIIDEIR